MNLSLIGVVMRKELTDGVRDRRALYTVLLSALFGPLVIAFMLNQLAGQQRSAQEIKVPIVGRQYAPILVNWLEQQSGVDVTEGPADAEAAVRERKQEFVLVIDKEFAKKFRQSRAALVKVVSDSTRQSAEPKVKRLRNLLSRFNGEMGSLRLMARGVSPVVATVLKVEDVEISNAQERAATIFNIIPLFLIAAAFSAGMQISTDATAGERERFSLEPLLITPVPRWQLITGKWLAACVASLVGMAATLGITAYVMSHLSLEDLGIRYHLGVPECLLIFGVIAPVGLIAPALQVYLACFAKTFKEAQSYMAFLVLVAILPGMFATFYPLGDHPWMKPIPILGQYALSVDILGGKMPGAAVLIGSALLSIAFACFFLGLASRLFASERIILGR